MQIQLIDKRTMIVAKQEIVTYNTLQSAERRQNISP